MATAPVQLTFSPGWEYHPVWSPDDSLIMFTARDGGDAELRLVAPTGGEPQTIELGATGDLYSDWFPDGESIVCDIRVDDGPGDLYRHHLATGVLETLTSNAGPDVHPTLSPDGEQIAFMSIRAGSQGIWIMDLDDRSIRPVAVSEASEWHPDWSPDGEHILFTSDRAGNPDIWIVPSGGGPARQLTRANGQDDRGVWSPDGSWIAFNSDRGGGGDIWIIPSAGGEALRLTTHPARDGNASWSSDGERIAFSSSRIDEDNTDIWIVRLDTQRLARIAGESGSGG